MGKEHQLDKTDGGLTLDRHVAAGGNPASQWEDEILLESLLDRLSDEEREIVVDRDICEYSFEEMAKKQGKTPDAIRMQYNRIQIKLKNMVNDDCRT